MLEFVRMHRQRDSDSDCGGGMITPIAERRSRANSKYYVYTPIFTHVNVTHMLLHVYSDYYRYFGDMRLTGWEITVKSDYIINYCLIWE